LYCKLSGMQLLPPDDSTSSISSLRKSRLHRHYKGKGKVHPRTGHEGPEGEQRYSSTLSLTWVLDGRGWSMPRPSHFIPRKDPVPLYRRLVGPQSRSGHVRKISSPPGFDPQTVQPLASCYTDYTIPAPLHRHYYSLLTLSTYSLYWNFRHQTLCNKHRNLKLKCQAQSKNMYVSRSLGIQHIVFLIKP
jgi:hypothetical protein